MGRATAKALHRVFETLLACYGPQHWWPGETPLEVIVGAILTQNTSWTNAARAIEALKTAEALNPAALRETEIDALAQLIRSSGYFNAKARKLRAIAEFIGEAGDNLNARFHGDTQDLRQQLLAVHGVGPETADSILLYAANRPVFVIDAYTGRIAGRLGLTPPDAKYHELQRLFETDLPLDTALFNEYHALLVRHGKDVCRPTPRCEECCLKKLCPRHGLDHPGKAGVGLNRDKGGARGQ